MARTGKKSSASSDKAGARPEKKKVASKKKISASKKAVARKKVTGKKKAVAKKKVIASRKGAAKKKVVSRKKAAAGKRTAVRKKTGDGNKTAKVSGKHSRITRSERRHMIAEAAYLRAEARGFGSNEHEDWLVAEAQVDCLLEKAGIIVGD